MLCLLQDIVDEAQAIAPPQFDRVSQFVTLVTGASAPIAPPAAILGLTYIFVKWLSDAVLERIPKVERTITAYVVDLISVLKALFEITCVPRLIGKTNWDVVQQSFESYERSPSRQLVHSSCKLGIQDRAEIVGQEGFRKKIRELLDL